MYWVLILTLLFIGWRLSQPELSQWILLLKRKRHWLGTLKPEFLGVDLYEDPRDDNRFAQYIEQDSSLRNQLQNLAQQLAHMSQKRSPRVNTRLCLAAQLYAESMSRGGEVSQAQVLRFISSHLGICTPIPWVVHLTTSKSESPIWIIERFNQNLYEVLQKTTHDIQLGIAQMSMSDTEKITVLLMQPMYATLRPVSRYLEGDMGLSIHGELEEYMPLTLWITPPQGRPYQEDLKQDGVHFSFQLYDRTRGIYQIELMAESSQGPVVCLNYQIYRSVKVSHELVLTTGNQASRFQWINRYALIKLTQKTRQRESLPTLKHHRALSRIAQKYAQEMATHDFVAHTSPQGEGLHHRLANLSFDNEKVLENLSVGTNIEEIYDRLVSSPAHLAAILDDEVTHMGVGICKKGNLFFGVQLFSLLNRRLNVHIDKTQVQRMIQQQRKLQGLGRLPLLQELEDTASKVARALVVGRCRSHEVMQHATHILSKEHQQTYPIEVIVIQVNHISQFPEKEAWLVNQVKGLGLGLAQGRSDEPIWIVMILRIHSRSNQPLLSTEF